MANDERGTRLEGILIFPNSDHPDVGYIARGHMEEGQDEVVLRGPDGGICGQASLVLDATGSIALELSLANHLQDDIEKQGGFRLLLNRLDDDRRRYTSTLEVGVKA